VFVLGYTAFFQMPELAEKLGIAALGSRVRVFSDSGEGTEKGSAVDIELLPAEQGSAAAAVPHIRAVLAKLLAVRRSREAWRQRGAATYLQQLGNAALVVLILFEHRVC
jgi:hypothetical protein